MILKSSSVTDSLERDLLEQIQKGLLKPGDFLLPVRELSKKYKISYNSVRKTTDKLSRQGLLTSWQGKGIVVTEPARDEEIINIGFLFCTIFAKIPSDPFMVKVFNGIQRQLKKQRTHLASFSVSEDDQKKLLIPRPVLEKEIKGLLVMGHIMPKYILKLKKLTIPMVIIDTHIIKGIDSISTDNINSAYMAVEYLASLGHRRIAIIFQQLQDQSLHIGRFRGYKLVIDALGLEYDQSIVKVVDFISDGGYRAMKKILSTSPLPTAIFAGNDIIAINAMRAIREKGLRIPDDISIIGFDDIEIARYSDPPLTTMRVLKEEIGKLAAARLTDIIEGKEENAVAISVMAELVKRKSCRKLKTGGIR